MILTPYGALLIALNMLVIMFAAILSLIATPYRPWLPVRRNLQAIAIGLAIGSAVSVYLTFYPLL